MDDLPIPEESLLKNRLIMILRSLQKNIGKSSNFYVLLVRLKKTYIQEHGKLGVIGETMEGILRREYFRDTFYLPLFNKTVRFTENVWKSIRKQEIRHDPKKDKEITLTSDHVELLSDSVNLEIIMDDEEEEEEDEEILPTTPIEIIASIDTEDMTFFQKTRFFEAFVRKQHRDFDVSEQDPQTEWSDDEDDEIHGFELEIPSTPKFVKTRIKGSNKLLMDWTEIYDWKNSLREYHQHIGFNGVEFFCWETNTICHYPPENTTHRPDFFERRDERRKRVLDNLDYDLSFNNQVMLLEKFWISCIEPLGRSTEGQLIAVSGQKSQEIQLFLLSFQTGEIIETIDLSVIEKEVNSIKSISPMHWVANHRKLYLCIDGNLTCIEFLSDYQSSNLNDVKEEEEEEEEEEEKSDDDDNLKRYFEPLNPHNYRFYKTNCSFSLRSKSILSHTFLSQIKQNHLCFCTLEGLIVIYNILTEQTKTISNLQRVSGFISLYRIIDEENEIILWIGNIIEYVSGENFRKIIRFETKEGEDVYNVNFSPIRKEGIIICGCKMGTIRIFDVFSRSCIYFYRVPNVPIINHILISKIRKPDEIAFFFGSLEKLIFTTLKITENYNEYDEKQLSKEKEEIEGEEEEEEEEMIILRTRCIRKVMRMRENLEKVKMMVWLDHSDRKYYLSVGIDGQIQAWKNLYEIGFRDEEERISLLGEMIIEEDENENEKDDGYIKMGVKIFLNRFCVFAVRCLM